MGNDDPNRSFTRLAATWLTICILLLSVADNQIECKKRNKLNNLCDFEQGVCDWTQLNSSTVDWIRKTGSSPGGPKYDQYFLSLFSLIASPPIQSNFVLKLKYSLF